jgi:hypothetical protein
LKIICLNNKFANLSIGPEIFIDADSKLSNLELGTQEHPFKNIDDAFRELFDRFQIWDHDGNDFNVTIYLRGRISQNLESLRIISDGIGQPTIIIPSNI